MKEPNKTEIYGFIGWIATFIAFILFLIWSFLPDSTLKSIGINYYPSKYWALAVPSYIIMLVIFVQIIYQGVNMICAEPHDSFNTLEDSCTRRIVNENKEFQGIPDISDIPVSVVNRVLYGKPKELPKLTNQRSYKGIARTLDN
ncbi:GPI19 [Blepharisma stoltei]|uniref:PIG-P domain-containing protein n=1 Tax=Blepharisma stoltei TaxID=1481888 RepID=A0AAU9IZV4_9CILI|nr:unnamed protein product [Blepharisma stoltei]